MDEIVYLISGGIGVGFVLRLLCNYIGSVVTFINSIIRAL